MRRSLIIAVAILATMTVALVALAVEPFVDGDTITDLPSDQATDQAPSDAAIADAASHDAVVAFVGAADWPPQVVDLLLVVGTAAFDIEALPDDIRVLVTETRRRSRHTHVCRTRCVARLRSRPSRAIRIRHGYAKRLDGRWNFRWLERLGPGW